MFITLIRFSEHVTQAQYEEEFGSAYCELGDALGSQDSGCEGLFSFVDLIHFFLNLFFKSGYNLSYGLALPSSCRFILTSHVIVGIGEEPCVAKYMRSDMVQSEFRKVFLEFADQKTKEIAHYVQHAANLDHYQWLCTAFADHMAEFETYLSQNVTFGSYYYNVSMFHSMLVHIVWTSLSFVCLL